MSVNPSWESSRSPRRIRSGSSRKLSGADRVQLAPLEVRETSEGIDELARLEAPGHRVDGEVAPRHVVRDRHGGIGDDLEVAMTRADARLPPRRCQLDPGRHERPDRPVARVEADADELAVHLHVLDPPVRLERGAQAGVVDARDEEVLVRVRDPEQLVAHGAPDDVRVEAERADVAADLGRHGRAETGAASAILQVGDGLDLDARAGGKPGHLERRAGRRPLADAGRVDLVHRLEVARGRSGRRSS